jgi:hypothetical protein
MYTKVDSNKSSLEVKVPEDLKKLRKNVSGGKYPSPKRYNTQQTKQPILKHNYKTCLYAHSRRIAILAWFLALFREQCLKSKTIDIRENT